MPMQRHAVANHFAVENIQSSEQRCGPVTLIVMSERSASPGFHRQSRLSSIQRLDLTLLINAQHESFLGRVHIKANNVPQFVNELRVSAEFESFGEMRFQIVLLPNPSDRSLAESLGFGHRSRTPMRCVSRLRL